MADDKQSEMTLKTPPTQPVPQKEGGKGQAAPSRAPDDPQRDDEAETQQNTPKASNTNEPVKFLGMTMPPSIADKKHRFDEWGSEQRTKSIQALPAFVVNNSSNIIGASHVITEGMMYKSGLKGGNIVEHAKNPIDWTFKAIGRIYGEAIGGLFKKNASDAIRVKSGNPVKDMFSYVTDMKAATEREIIAQGVDAAHVRLGNPYQNRATTSGLAAWTIAAIVPEKKESDEEVERMEIMRRVNPVKYVGTRLGQAVWVPGWMTHKREFIGFGQAAAGVFSILGAWRNRTKPSEVEMLAGKLPQYVFNAPYLGTGACSFAAGTALMMAPDEAKAYSQYGGWVTGMTAFLPFSLIDKFKNAEPGVYWYTGGKLSFQAQAWAQMLFGGAEKRPDGTIVDHTALRKEAAEKAAQIRAEKREHRGGKKHEKDEPEPQQSQQPKHIISSGTSLERVAEAPNMQLAPGGV